MIGTLSNYAEGDWDLSGRVEFGEVAGKTISGVSATFISWRLWSADSSPDSSVEPDDSCSVNADFYMRASGPGLSITNPHDQRPTEARATFG